eukprot:CAMPEP_0184397112 /NCGR_PEP_ID=MMETSP0007-20130409/58123_1 /TAXON_ID=97485 /ORGANISM="Prymnesium parvum, Strain Texoma1" /LENGTH=95 /DNA_ID=CAMNT_0026750389 /DNA_START=174 /DNA_END=458 /DNA_ORIENTATION=+
MRNAVIAGEPHTMLLEYLLKRSCDALKPLIPDSWYAPDPFATTPPLSATPEANGPSNNERRDDQHQHDHGEVLQMRSDVLVRAREGRRTPLHQLG